MKLRDALPPHRPLVDVLPNLADRSRAMGLDPTLPMERRIFGTRRLARQVIASQETPPDVIDFDGVQVATTPFLHELRIAWPGVRPVGMSASVAAGWALVSERLGDA